MTAAKLKNKLKENRVSVIVGVLGLALSVWAFLFGGWSGVEKTNAANEEWKKNVIYEMGEMKTEINKKVSVELFQNVVQNNNNDHYELKQMLKEQANNQKEENNLLHEVIGELKHKK